MNSNIDTTEASHLLQELLRVQHSFQGCTSSSSLLAVARLVPGLDLASWQKLAADAALSGWCALEMTENGQYRCQWQSLADAMPAEDSLSASLHISPFMQQLDREIIRARRGQSEVSLVVFEVGENSDVLVDRLSEILRETAEPCDSTSEMGNGRCALLLPGAGIYKAQDIAERVCMRFNEKNQHCRAGIACARGGIADPAVLVQQAAEALNQAAASGRAVCVHCVQTKEELIPETLVQTNEKRFLFGGDC